jgi:hypothetical protein
VLRRPHPRHKRLLWLQVRAHKVVLQQHQQRLAQQLGREAAGAGDVGEGGAAEAQQHAEERLAGGRV